jgi:hypothetical protein
MHHDCLVRIAIPHPGRIEYVDRLCSSHKVTQNHFIKIKNAIRIIARFGHTGWVGKRTTTLIEHEAENAYAIATFFQ